MLRATDHISLLDLHRLYAGNSKNKFSDTEEFRVPARNATVPAI